MSLNKIQKFFLLFLSCFFPLSSAYLKLGVIEMIDFQCKWAMSFPSTAYLKLEGDREIFYWKWTTSFSPTAYLKLEGNRKILYRKWTMSFSPTAYLKLEGDREIFLLEMNHKFLIHCLPEAGGWQRWRISLPELLWCIWWRCGGRCGCQLQTGGRRGDRCHCRYTEREPDWSAASGHHWGWYLSLQSARSRMKQGAEHQVRQPRIKGQQKWRQFC